MKKTLRFPKSFGDRSIREKLIVSFTVPVMLAMLIAMFCVHKFLMARSEKQILSSAMSSYSQSCDLTENYLQLMSYVSESIYYSGDLQRILSDPSFTEERSMDIRHREYLRLLNVFVSAEYEKIIYRAGIYIRDDIPYTNDKKNIMPLNALYRREDYALFEDSAQKNRYYYSAPVDLYTSGIDEPVSAVTLLRPVRSTSGTRRYICVEQVSVETETFRQTLSYANMTKDSLTYLVDEQQRLITATDAEVYETLRQQGALPENGNDEDWETRTIGGKRYYMLRRYIPQARWTLVSLIPQEDVAAQSSYLNIIVIFLTLLILGSIVLVAYLLANSYTLRLHNLNTMIQKVRSGELAVPEYQDTANDELSELFKSFNEMTCSLQELMRQQYRSGKAVKAAELRALQAQINPHFLYNTLDLINWEAFDHDAPEISEIAQNLARFYRISLNKGRPVVTIREELEHVSAYLSIENRHFDGNIFLHTDVPEELQALGCINIILQPFVENAIIHGIAEDPSRGECSIRISARRETGDVIFTVEDDGPGMTPEQIGAIFEKNTTQRTSGYGVKNIQSRIQLSFGEDYGVTYDTARETGTAVFIRIPALTPEELEKRLEDL